MRSNDDAARDKTPIGTRKGFYVKKLIVEVYSEDGKKEIEVGTHKVFHDRAELDSWMKRCGMLE